MMNPESRDRFLGKMACSIGATELAVFNVRGAFPVAELEAVVHFRPGESDAQTRAAALAAFKEIAAPCVAQKNNGAICIEGTWSEASGDQQYCLVVLGRHGQWISGVTAVIVRCPHETEARRRLTIFDLELSGHDMFKQRGLRGILFDLGDTLLDFDPLDPAQIFRDGAEMIYKKLKPQLPATLSFEEYCSRQSRAARWKYYVAKLTRREFDCMEMMTRYHAKLGVHLDLDTQLDMMWTWYQAMLRHAQFGEDVVSTLTALRDAGLKLGLVSNTFIPPLTHDRHLRESGLLDFFPVRVYSSEVKYRKPHRRIFEIALQRLGTQAHGTLFVGDQIAADIRGARRVGMKTAWRCRNGSTFSAAGSDYCIRNVAELLKISVE
jgi:putative hydrolase of the HAD superfamily